MTEKTTSKVQMVDGRLLTHPEYRQYLKDRGRFHEPKRDIVETNEDWRDNLKGLTDSSESAQGEGCSRERGSDAKNI